MKFREVELEHWLKSLSDAEHERFVTEALEFAALGGGYMTFVRDNGEQVQLQVSRTSKPKLHG